ncbi:metallophosphoesterase family protein [Anaeromicropila herbilytica]|uniref:Calcineurin-like phosphoesterase domain-containing protein n=1 Tax=Anaeromicropila herbilytica TaxID=2785025 RepID=A0A7R7IAY6_9FIRM|nr:exonuclease SbcCD subunit D [Anaeromicropila herbilytica]BCN28957.1 hypothetical protein bsdtb5_02520 [Anaeromicropila herbilytica]
MRFIHIADVHLGASPDSSYSWGKLRKREIMETFKKVIEVCKEEAVDLLLIAGDLFHKAPLVRELKEIDYLFGQIPNTRIVFIAGNHDYIGPFSNYLNYEFVSNVTMIRSEQMEHIYLEELNTEIYGFSYHTRDIMEAKYDDIRIEENDRIHILLAHGGDDKNIPIHKNRLKELGFDYIALGHIHKPDRIDKNIAYAGSLEPLDINETGERGYILGDINQQSCRLNFVPIAKRKYIHLKIETTPATTNEALFDQIKKEIVEKGIENIYRILIEGRKDIDIIYDMEAIYELGKIYDVIDNTILDYDFDQLYEDNKDNMIGLYIDSICNAKEEDDVIQKALYYGMEALLKAKG